MGRPRKPTKTLKLEGAFKKDPKRARPDEPEPEGVPILPGELGHYGLDQWNRVIPQLVKMGVATEVDSDSLYAMCKEWDRYMSGTHSALGNWIKIAGRFGLTPSDRAGLVVKQKEPDKGLEAMLA